MKVTINPPTVPIANVTGGAPTASPTFTGSVGVPSGSGSASSWLDASTAGGGTNLVIANNATATPFGATQNFSGLILVMDTNVDGEIALFLTAAGVFMTLVSQNAGHYSTTLNSAGEMNVYLVGGVVTIQNKLGSSSNVIVFGIRLRST